MTKHEFASAACKILGLYFMANAVHGAANVLISFITLLPGLTSVGEALRTLLTSLPYSLVGLWIGAIIWRRADAIARLIAPEDS